MNILEKINKVLNEEASDATSWVKSIKNQLEVAGIAPDLDEDSWRGFIREVKKIDADLAKALQSGKVITTTFDGHVRDEVRKLMKKYE